MKKYLSLLLAMLMILTALFTVVACQDTEQPNGSKDPTTDEDNKPPVVTPPDGRWRGGAYSADLPSGILQF